MKYCGGCDPAFDRVEYWQAISDAAGESIEWLRPDDDGWQVMLMICGCAKACPLEEMPEDRPMLIVKDDTMAPADVVAGLLAKIS